MKNPTALPSKLVRSRSFRPKQIRPLKETPSEKSDSEPEYQPNLRALRDPMSAAGTRMVFYNKNKLILHGTDANTLNEAEAVLSRHFAKKMVDQML